MVFFIPAGVCPPASKTESIQGKKRNTSRRSRRRDVEREQVWSAGMFLAQCPGVCSRGVPIPRAPPLDMSLIICCVTVVSLDITEASAGCARVQALMLANFFVCVCV